MTQKQPKKIQPLEDLVDCTIPDAKPLPTDEEVEANAGESVARAVEYFRSQGIDLGYVPTVKYKDEFLQACPRADAAVNSDVEFFKNAADLLGGALLRTIYEKLFGLHISDEALAETIEVGKHELSKPFPDGDLGKDADIFLFKPIKNAMGTMDKTMVQEVWHLIEKKYGFLNGTSYIHEGTATYVANRFAGRASPSRGTETDYLGVLYENAAHIVEQEVGKATEPLQAILNPVKREAINQRFDTEVLPLFYQKVAEELASGSLQHRLRDIVLNDPNYAVFAENPTRETLLQALRQKGNVKLAADLSLQDLTKAVDFYKRLFASADDEHAHS